MQMHGHLFVTSYYPHGSSLRPLLLRSISAVPCLASCPNPHPATPMCRRLSHVKLYIHHLGFTLSAWQHAAKLIGDCAMTVHKLTRAFLLVLSFWILGLKLSLPVAAFMIGDVRWFHLAGDGPEHDAGQYEPGGQIAILHGEWTYHSSGCR